MFYVLYLFVDYVLAFARTLSYVTKFLKEIRRNIFWMCFVAMRVTVAARSQAWTVFARSDAGIVGSKPTQCMDVWCVYAFILCLCCPVFR
jgi:predicted phosphoadenosine phosphosulfate sulfurtransferase